MDKKRGFTLIELIITMCIMATVSSGMAFCVSSYHVVQNNYEVKFAENSILAVISNAKQYCREKNVGGYILFDISNNEIKFSSGGQRREYFKMPRKTKLDNISVIDNKIDINNKGIIAGDACTITIEDAYGKYYNITICVGSFYVEVK